MSTRTTSRALGWLIGLLLLVCWNLQAEVRLKFTGTDSIQASKSFREPNTAIDPTPISLTATAGCGLPASIAFRNTSRSEHIGDGAACQRSDRSHRFWIRYELAIPYLLLQIA